MHELAVTESILEIAVRNGNKAGAKRVTHINIVIGQLSSIVDDSVRFYWDIISEETICKGASLVFDRVPARLLCLACRQEFTLAAELEPCPYCSSAQIKILSGEEFRVESIEIETEEQAV